jgi:hypothetical protein
MFRAAAERICKLANLEPGGPRRLLTFVGPPSKEAAGLHICVGPGALS